MSARLRIHGAAVLNAREFDRRMGGQTYPDDVIMVWGRKKKKAKKKWPVVRGRTIMRTSLNDLITRSKKDD